MALAVDLVKPFVSCFYLFQPDVSACDYPSGTLKQLWRAWPVALVL
ncbi:hypothetical protein EV13_0093 [Prochlorococcus sp. MIT 0702]|nr:hypothetical protein EV13_0093 [Prochlorococcus sp. MIT 0702]